MALTTFSGPVSSLNGFIGGTVTDPITVTTAQNISSSYATTSAATGDTRLSYNKLTFTAGGGGETTRSFSVVNTGTAGVGGTVNGSHVSLEIDAAGTISGAGNAIRATLGGTAIAPGGTLAAIQLDTNFAAGVSTPATSSFIRVTDSGAGTGKINNLMNIGSLAAASVAPTATSVTTVSKALKVMVNGVTYYVPAYATFA